MWNIRTVEYIKNLNVCICWSITKFRDTRQQERVCCFAADVV